MKITKTIIIIIIISLIGIISLESIILPMTRPSKETLIRNFNKNFDIFQSVSVYAINTEGYLNVNRTAFLISYNNITNEDEIKNMNPVVKKHIKKIIRNLKYVRIDDCDGIVTYYRNTGGFEQGIIFCEKDIVPDYPRYVEKIKDHWYYYWTTHE